MGDQKGAEEGDCLEEEERGGRGQQGQGGDARGLGAVEVFGEEAEENEEQRHLYGVRDAACPLSTRGGTRLVRLVRGRGSSATCLAQQRRSAHGASATGGGPGRAGQRRQETSMRGMALAVRRTARGWDSSSAGWPPCTAAQPAQQTAMDRAKNSGINTLPQSLQAAPARARMRMKAAACTLRRKAGADESVGFFW